MYEKWRREGGRLRWGRKEGKRREERTSFGLFYFGFTL
jgi:hypothetical protein